MSSNLWEKLKLEELIDSVSIKHDFNKEELIFLNTSDILDGKILHKNYSAVSSMPGQAKKSIQKGDILFSEIRPKNKRFAMIDFSANDFVVSTKLMVIRKKNEKISKEFLYKYLTANSTLEYLQKIAEGRSGTFPQITFNELKNIEINLPPLEEQKAIAKILSDLDAKIEVNNQISQRLEEMAQALFKHWFVDFEFPNEDGEPYKSSGGEMIESELGMIPKGWEVGTLSQIANVLMGQSPKGSSYNEEKQGEIFYQGRTDFNFRFPSIRLYTTEPKRMAEAGDVLMSVRAPVGDINIAKQRCCIGRGLAAIRSNSNHQSFVLYTMNNLQKALSIYNGEGTIFGSINKDTLNNLKVLIPDNTIIDSFEWTVKKSDEMIRNLAEQTDILKQTRDTLLPKLMSGELRVTNIQD